MKAILKFDLNDPDDRLSHKQCVKASDMAKVLWEFSMNSKKALQYSLEQDNIDGCETLDRVFERFHELLDQHNVNIDELMT